MSITANLYVRCLTCWTPLIASVQVERHLPPAIQAACVKCGRDRLFATTGQIVPTLTPAQVRLLHRAQKTKTRPDWEQLPLSEALLPTGSGAPLGSTAGAESVRPTKVRRR